MKIKRSSLVLAFILIGITSTVLLQKTLVPTRSIEFKPESQPFAIAPHESLSQQIMVHPSTISHVSFWLAKNSNGEIITDGYQTLSITLQSTTGQLTQSLEEPKIIQQNDDSILLFKLSPFHVPSQQQVSVKLTQTGTMTTYLRPPHPNMIEPNEDISLAIQFLQKQTWIRAFFGQVNNFSLDGHDASFYFHRGNQIAEGINPYTCAATEQRTCNGFPSHFPGMYWVSAAIISLGAETLEQWTIAWRLFITTAWISIGLIISIQLMIKNKPSLAIFALVLWLLNRWSLYVLLIAQTDFVGVIFLILSTITIYSFPLASALFLGFSLAVKHVAIIIVPVFLIITFYHKKLYWKKRLSVLVLLLTPILVPSLPFLIDDHTGFMAGLSNVVLRPSQTDYENIPSLDAILQINHFGRLGLIIFLLSSIYIAVWRKSVSYTSGALLLMSSLIFFSPVLFHQYFVWLIPFVPLTILEFWNNKEQASKVVANTNTINNIKS